MQVQQENHEQDLLLLVAKGDEKAFSELFHRYRNKIYSMALEITRSAPISEEILLDVFLKVWLKRDQLSEIQHFRAWLFTVARNRIYSALKQVALRKNTTATIDEDELLFHICDDSNTFLLEKEYRNILHKAIAKLPPQQKKVYLLIKEHGLKREQAAQELNLSPETVKRHLSEAMHFIRTYCLSHMGISAAVIVLKNIL
ncbi:RNA polymerase sigma-70 factor [Chitinophaga caeni]|uniref:RNA polymerase sigma-70 factor n=1 Tax=Chitinophaga caeni TaxID=2029983 RepID=A0A291QSX0_9BACT|nr:sigma-70 family RNA polymerase sigma factor [Chitinophaga caeni]ATL46963.1 RNA polymerase sigma-70 factor [Chitinophaga caeni]